jgi:clan AA aspartic protease (TIGR02281 family)
MLNGKVAARMVVDTGASLTTISSKLASRIGLKPDAGDSEMKAKIADGSEVPVKKATIPSLRIGQFTVRNVECAIMPDSKADVDCLLGNSFFSHFSKVELNSQSAKLVLKKHEIAEPEADSKDAFASDSKPASKAVAKNRTPRRETKAAPKSKRSTVRRRQPTMPDEAFPDGVGVDPN